MPGKYEKQKPKKKKSAVKIILTVLLVLLLVVALVVGGMYILFKNKYKKVNVVQMPRETVGMYDPEQTLEDPTEASSEATEATETTETTAATTETVPETEPPKMKPEDIINVLVVGQSARPGEEAHMADTMILVSLNTYNKTLTLTSILRDSWADFPPYAGHGAGRNKITNAYALGYSWTGNQIGGAMEMMNQVLKLNFGVEVDYNFEVDFDQFIKIIDFMGGVHVELTEAEAKYLNNDTLYVKRTLEPGRVRLYGMEALSFARMRHAEGDSDSDIKRSERQRRLISAIVEKLKKKSISELNQLLNIMLDKITTNMTGDEVLALGVKVLPMLADLKVETGVCPFQSKGELVDIYGDGVMHSVLKFDRTLNTKHMRAITEGEVE